MDVIDDENREDTRLRDLCVEFQVEEAYGHLRERGIRFDLVHKLTLKDIDDFLPQDSTRVLFRTNWEKWMDGQKEGVDEAGGSSRYLKPKNTDRPKKTKVWTSVDLDDILKCKDGEKLLAISQNKKNFEKRHRELLINVILTYADDNSIHLSCTTIQTISEDIERIFPHEKQEIYYKPKSEVRKSYGGILFTKYHNSKRGYKRKKITEKENESTPELIEVPVESEANSPQQDILNEDSLSILKNPDIVVLSPEIFRHWTATSETRLSNISAGDILLDWPVLSLEHGYKLISEDFLYLYPFAEEINSKWTPFFEKIVLFLEDNIKDRHNKTKFDDALGETNSDQRQKSLLLILHSVLQPQRQIRLQLPNKKKMIKPTISDAQQSMIIEIEKMKNIESRLKIFKKHLKDTERTFHPIIFHIKNEGYVVYSCEKISYRVTRVQDAVDVCFKSVHVFNSGQYPLESGSVWYFIQRYFYNIETKSDTHYTGRSDFENLVKFCQRNID